MAGSRTEKIGTIFTRVRGLLRTAAMKDSEKPLWYDVYEAFPPRVEPLFDRPTIDRAPINILYREDVVRAHFYKTFGNPDVIDMKDNSASSLGQKFISKYGELEKVGSAKSGDVNLFETTADSLRNDGITLHTLEELKKENEKRKLDVQAPTKLKDLTSSQQLTSETVFGNQTVASQEGQDTDFIDDTFDDIVSSKGKETSQR